MEAALEASGKVAIRSWLRLQPPACTPERDGNCSVQIGISCFLQSSFFFFVRCREVILVCLVLVCSRALGMSWWSTPPEGLESVEEIWVWSFIKAFTAEQLGSHVDSFFLVPSMWRVFSS